MDHEEQAVYSPQDELHHLEQHEHHEHHGEHSQHLALEHDPPVEDELDPNEFYFRYYVGHHAGQFGHEFLEFTLRQDGTLLYANNSEYKRDTLIRKSVRLGEPLIAWIKKQVEDSNIINADDSTWPEPDEVGRQEVEVKLNGQHVFFVTTKISSLSQLLEMNADDSLRTFYDLTHDIKQWFFDIIGLHFRLKTI